MTDPSEIAEALKWADDLKAGPFMGTGGSYEYGIAIAGAYRSQLKRAEEAEQRASDNMVNGRKGVERMLERAEKAEARIKELEANLQGRTVSCVCGGQAKIEELDKALSQLAITATHCERERDEARKDAAEWELENVTLTAEIEKLRLEASQCSKAGCPSELKEEITRMRDQYEKYVDEATSAYRKKLDEISKLQSIVERARRWRCDSRLDGYEARKLRDEIDALDALRKSSGEGPLTNS